MGSEDILSVQRDFLSVPTRRLLHGVTDPAPSSAKPGIITPEGEELGQSVRPTQTDFYSEYKIVLTLTSSKQYFNQYHLVLTT